MPKYKHRVCPCGCGELADECMSPGGALNAFSIGESLVAARDAADQRMEELGRYAEKAEAALAGLVERLERAEADLAAARDDLAAILRALGLGDHARPISSHEVVVTEVLPRAKHLRQQLDQVRALTEQDRVYPDTIRAVLDRKQES
jgi:hypothetical protein